MLKESNVENNLIAQLIRPLQLTLVKTHVLELYIIVINDMIEFVANSSWTFVLKVYQMFLFTMKPLYIF